MSAKTMRLSAAVNRVAFELAPFHSRWQVAISIEISGKAEKHEDRGDTKAIVPAINLGEETAEQRSDNGANIDRGGEDDETTGAPRFVLRRIKGTYLRRNIPFQETRANN